MQGPWRRSIQRGNVTNMVATSLRNCSKMAPKWFPNGSQMAPKLALEASWTALGGLLEFLVRLGRPRGDFQGLMGRSWKPLGSLLGLKKEVLNGSWPLQDEYQDSFQTPWGQKAVQRVRKRVHNRAQEVTRAEKRKTSRFDECLAKFLHF